MLNIDVYLQKVTIESHDYYEYINQRIYCAAPRSRYETCCMRQVFYAI